MERRPKLLLLVAQGELELFSSEEIISEVQDVLSRLKLAKRLAKIGRKPADLIGDLRLIVTLVHPAKIPRTSRDLDDDIILGTAVSASVKIIISGDRDLLVLKHFQGIAILTPAQFPGSRITIQNSTRAH